MELGVASWRSSFFTDRSEQNPSLRLFTARAGNVIGGGDWSPDRIVPDIVRAFSKNNSIELRNPASTRPWQHVLEPLAGYLLLAQNAFISQKPLIHHEFNFGPHLESNRSVLELVHEVQKSWAGKYKLPDVRPDLHESVLLNLSIDRAFHQLSYLPRWSFELNVMRTIQWYKKNLLEGVNALQCCDDDLTLFLSTIHS